MVMMEIKTKTYHNFCGRAATLLLLLPLLLLLFVDCRCFLFSLFFFLVTLQFCRVLYGQNISVTQIHSLFYHFNKYFFSLFLFLFLFCFISSSSFCFFSFFRSVMRLGRSESHTQQLKNLKNGTKSLRTQYTECKTHNRLTTITIFN